MPARLLLPTAANELADASLAHALVQIFRNLDVAKYVGVASATVLVYDWTLTIDEEVAFVWPSRWGWPKILYLFNRYTVFADAALIIYVLLIGTDAQTCVSSFQAIGGTSAFGFATAQIILAMRTWAIWSRRAWVTTLLSVLIVATLSVDVFVLIRYLGNITYVTTFTSPIDGCLLQFGNRFVFIDFIEIIVLETTMLILLVLKALQDSRYSRSTLMMRMLNDGVIYFLYIFASSIINLCTILLAPLEQHNMFIITQRVFHSIFCTRVLLHIRGAYTNNALAMKSADASGAGGAIGQSSSRNTHFAFRRTGSGLLSGGDTRAGGGGVGDRIAPDGADDGVFELVDASKRESAVRFSGRVYGGGDGDDGDDDGDGAVGGWGHGDGLDRPRSPSPFFSPGPGADDTTSQTCGVASGFDVEEVEYDGSIEMAASAHDDRLRRTSRGLAY